MKKFSINPIGLLVWVWLFAFRGVFYGINYIVAILLHELGHYLTAKKLGYKLSRFSLSPYGVSLSYYGQTLNANDEFVIAFAGPLANILSCVLMLGVWWIFPNLYFFLQSFVEISFALAIFNLLPVYPLDGGRIFVCLFQKFVEEKRAQKITIILNVVFSVLFFVFFVFSIFLNFNPTLLLFSIFMFGGVLELSQKTRYEKINVFFKRHKNFSKIVLLAVDVDTKLCDVFDKISLSNKTIFGVEFESGKIVFLSEKMVQNLMFKFAPNKTLKEIFKNIK